MGASAPGNLGRWPGAIPVAPGRAKGSTSQMQVQRWLGFGLGIVLAIGWCGGEAVAQISLYPAEVERLDVLSIQQDGRNLYAFNSLTGSRARVRLEIEEIVLFNESRGRVGIVLTDRRALGLTVGGNFQEVRYRLAERVPDFAVVSERVALVATTQRVLGFVGKLGGWIEETFPPGESAEALRVGTGVGIVTTNRRALGLAPDVGVFASISFRLKESLESIDAQDTLATLRTDQRIMVFSGPRAAWTFRARDLDPD